MSGPIESDMLLSGNHQFLRLHLARSGTIASPSEVWKRID